MKKWILPLLALLNLSRVRKAQINIENKKGYDDGKRDGSV